ncbi:MAG: alanine--tRNA ligase-related protein, partial [Woeseiales bacterium]
MLDRTVFYALGGGQPGDTGSLSWDGDSVDVVDTRYGENGEIRHLVAAGTNLPEPGTAVTATLDWDRRYLHMRMHTALHLLGAVLNYGVTGGNVSATKSRLDFDMEDGVDKDQVNASLK